MKRRKNKGMNLDQQIQVYEDQISQLEQIKRTMISKSGDLQNEHHIKIPESDLNRINADLDKYYQHYTILKIRKMMGF